MNQAASVTEIELAADQFIAAAIALAPSPARYVEPKRIEKVEQCSPIVECGFKENVVGRVAPEHMKHREDCVYNSHCCWCVQTGRSAMELRNYKELDAIAEAKFMRLVKKGHPEAVCMYMKRRERDESLWARIKYLLGI